MSDRLVWAATISRRPLSVTYAPWRGRSWCAPSCHHIPSAAADLTGGAVGTHGGTLIPGDGVGPELVDAARVALEATGVSFSWDVQPAGLAVAEREGSALPSGVLESIRETGVALKGPLGTPTGFRSVNVALRVALDLYASVRPCFSYRGIRSRYEGVGGVVVREATEGSYTGVEFEQGTVETAELIRFIERTTGARIREDSGLSIKAISEAPSERVGPGRGAPPH